MEFTTILDADSLTVMHCPCSGVITGYKLYCYIYSVFSINY